MIIVDASAVGSILLPDELSPPEWAEAELIEGPLAAPSHWPLEVANLLVIAERKRRIDAVERRRSIDRAIAMRVQTADDTGRRTWESVVALAVEHGLTVYDAAYLEMAIRTGARLATLDGKLRQAAVRQGIEIISWGASR